jgi:uncharacterized protein
VRIDEELPVQLSASAQDLQSTIDEFTARVPEITAAALATSDGLLVTASEGFDRDHADELAAVACGVVSIVTGSTARMFDDDQVELAVAAMSRRTLMVKPVQEGTVLAVVATAKADIPNTGVAVTGLADRLSQMITPALLDELQQALPL